MDKSLIKNYIIIILALVNAFLLYLVLYNAIAENKSANYRKEALESILRENGITLNQNIEMPDKIPSKVSLKRDNEKEHKLISALIGNCEATDKGGNIYYYHTSDGAANFRGTGVFDIQLSSGVVSKGTDPIATAKAVLKKLGISYSSIVPDVETDVNSTKVIFYCSLEDTPVYNAKIAFQFNGDSLVTISGSRPLDNEFQIVSSDSYLDNVTILMNFLELIQQTGDVCSEIDDLKIGYYLSSSVSGDCTLSPVWYIQTNLKAYYLDAQTGQANAVDSSD